MKNFNYANAASVAETLEILQHEKEKAYLVAGATSALPFIRNGKINNKTLINIRNIEELRYVRVANKKVLIGPLTTLADIEKSTILQKYAPALVEAALNFADPTIRNSATIGGNIASASPAADTAAPLLALNAVVTAVSAARGERRIPINEFFVGVNKTALECDELIAMIEVPKEAANRSSWFIKLGLRNAMAISLVSVAASVMVKAGKVQKVSIALGSVAATPVRANSVEKALLGTEFSALNIEAAAQSVGGDISPITDVRASREYRQDMAVVLVKRALKKIGNL